jgi:ribosomal protein L40E
MNKFDGRSAVEEYMSSHPLSYSTPDLILKEFVIWLCEEVDDPKGNSQEKIPRILLYTKLEEKGGSGSSYESTKDRPQSPQFNSSGATMKMSTSKPEFKFCIECGAKLKSNTKFCTKCGTKQEDI